MNLHLFSDPGAYNYWVVIILMMVGLYTVMARSNMVKTLIGLNIFQVGVFFLYITMGKVQGGTAPIVVHGQDQVFSNAVTHVLILTAIVVGVATTSVGLALVVRIHEAFGTIDEDDLLEIEREEELQ